MINAIARTLRSREQRKMKVHVMAFLCSISKSQLEYVIMQLLIVQNYVYPGEGTFTGNDREVMAI